MTALSGGSNIYNNNYTNQQQELTNIIPSVNNTYTLGNSSLQWADVYSVLINAGVIAASSSVSTPTVNADTVQAKTTNGDLMLLSNGTGSIDITSSNITSNINLNAGGSGQINANRPLNVTGHVTGTSFVNAPNGEFDTIVPNTLNGAITMTPGSGGVLVSAGGIGVPTTGGTQKLLTWNDTETSISSSSPTGGNTTLTFSAKISMTDNWVKMQWPNTANFVVNGTGGNITYTSLVPAIYRPATTTNFTIYNNSNNSNAPGIMSVTSGGNVIFAAMGNGFVASSTTNDIWAGAVGWKFNV